jgi:hypothetical protein
LRKEETVLQRDYLRPARVLSYFIAGLASVASIGGLLLGGLYRGTAFVDSTWLGNDLVTLVVAVPLLLIALLLAGRGSLRAQLVWIGMLDYMLYNFAFYLFGAAFNGFFFIYVMLFALCIWALVLSLMSLDVDRMATRFKSGVASRAVALFMAFVGLALTTIYFLQWLEFAMSGEVPLVVQMSGHPTNLVFALDLSIVVPVLLVGSVLLWRNRRWGLALAVMGNVKGAVYMLALSAATVTAYRAGTVDAMTEVGLWASIGVGSAAAALVLLRRLRS